MPNFDPDQPLEVGCSSDDYIFRVVDLQERCNLLLEKQKQDKATINDIEKRVQQLEQKFTNKFPF
jgi:hypothetical protein